MKRLIFTVSLLLFPIFSWGNNLAIDNYALEAMHAYHVPVVSLAIINNGKITYRKAYSIDPRIKATPESLFQAASISKSIAALGALRLVQKGKLSLDKPANNFLSSWKIPKNEFNKAKPVTLREILSMTSGLSVAGFPGHEQGKPLPNLIQLLNGEAPANTKPIRVFYTPGSKYFYSGGGFEVLEQMMKNSTHQSFPILMKQLVLKPLNMNHSYFQFPLSTTLREEAVPAFNTNDKEIKSGWNNYSAGAAAGMWSTPTDLARFVLGITAAYHGYNPILNQQLAKEMLTRQKNSSFGLGVDIEGKGKNLNFRKGGTNAGYQSLIIMFPDTEQGAVIMTDSDHGRKVINYLIAIIAKENNWPNYFHHFDELIKIP